MGPLAKNSAVLFLPYLARVACGWGLWCGHLQLSGGMHGCRVVECVFSYLRMYGVDHVVSFVGWFFVFVRTLLFHVRNLAFAMVILMNAPGRLYNNSRGVQHTIQAHQSKHDKALD